MQAATFLKRAWPEIAAILAMLLVCMAYFSPQLSGSEVPSGDIISYRGMSQELRAHEAATGERSLWTNSMFGGMPAYQLSAPERGNLLRFVEDVIHLGFDRPIGYFFALMVGMFILLRVLNVSVWLSAIGAIVFGLGANHMTLFEAGHMTKLRAISFMAPTLAGLIVLFRGKFIAGLSLFAVALGLNLYANHPQMTYYLAAACGCFVVFQFIRGVQEGQLPRFGKALAFSLLGAGLALGAQYSKLSTTLEYSRDTMRGAPILTSDAGAAATPTSSSEVEGLEWGYAMNWSNGIQDVMASFIAGAAGGSNNVEVESDGPLAKALRQVGNRLPPNFSAPLYHGALPSTSGPAYFGAVVVFLFIVGLFWMAPGWRYFFGSAVLLTLLISMGKHAEWINRPLFDLIPFFNTFRSPSSATSVTAFLVVAGAFFGLSQLFRFRENPSFSGAGRISVQSLGIGTGITLALALGTMFLMDSLGGFDSASDPILEQRGYPVGAILAERAAYLSRTGWRAVLLVSLAAGTLYLLMRKNLSTTVALTILGLLSVFDVWSVSRDYLSQDDFLPARQVAAQIQQRPVDKQILADTDPNYRVLDLSINTFNDAKVSYWHKTIGGYHAAKLQRAQDLIDRHISQGNKAVLDMLNTKYIVTGQRGSEQVQSNPDACGNAWFVQEVRMVDNANAEIDALTGLAPKVTAIVHQDFSDVLPARSFSGSGTIELSSYAPDRITYTSASNAQQLAVFSEMWYGPDKGWKVTIDGTPAKLLRANYALRALPLPAGNHEIVMYFEPDTFYTGERISYVASGIILALAACGLFFGFRENGKAAEDDGAPSAGASAT